MLRQALDATASALYLWVTTFVTLVDLLCLTHFTHFACDLTDILNTNPNLMHKIVKLNMIPAKQPLVFVLVLDCREIRGTWQKPNICNFQICGKGPSSLGPLQFFVGKNLNWDLGIRSKNKTKIVQIGMMLSLKSTSITFYISWGSMIGTSFQIGKNKTYTIWTAASLYYVCTYSPNDYFVQPIWFADHHKFQRSHDLQQQGLKWQ